MSSPSNGSYGPDIAHGARIAAPAAANGLESGVELADHQTMQGSISRVRTADGPVAEALQCLPAGFVVFHDVPLPRPSRARIDHVVVAPFGVWAIRVEAPNQPVTLGEGRGADTLWAGRTPLRIPIEECESDATVLAAALGRPVQPLLCVQAPLPSESFDFHGLLVCSPDALAASLVIATSDFEDVSIVARQLEDVSGVTSASTFELPRLGEAGPPALGAPQGRRRPRRRRVPRRARGSRVDRAKLFLVVGAAALVVALRPGWVGLAGGSDQPSLAPAAGVADAPATGVAEPPNPIAYHGTCGAEEVDTVEWTWPGPLPAGVASYGVRTRHADGVVIDHTLDGWRRADRPPPPTEITDDVVSIITEHRDANGGVLASTERPAVRPAPTDC